MSRSLALCGSVTRPHCDAEIRLRADGTAYVAGLVTCGSPWACPWCGPAIAAARAEELTELVSRAREHGLHATLLTLTIRHSRIASARVMFEGIARAWSAFIAGRWWLALQNSWGIAGFVRGIEATHGPNGWHPHIHAILLTKSPSSACAVERSMVALRWRSIVRRILGADFEPDDVHGVDIRDCNVAQYVAKIGFEVGSGTVYKHAADGHRTPWEIAQAVADHANPADIALWQDWQLATYGRKQLTWSQGAREILGRAEKTDEECASEPEAPTDVPIVAFSPAEWSLLCDAIADMLDAAELAPTVDAARAAVLGVACGVVSDALARGDPVALALSRDPRSHFYVAP